MPKSSKPRKRESKTTALPLKVLAVERNSALHPEDTVRAAGERMRQQHTATWPVAEDHKLVGTVDEQNPDWELGGHGHDPESWRVGQIMSREVVFCYEDEDCAQAERLMKDRGLDFLPVVDRQMRIVGIFSRKEVKEQASHASSSTRAPAARSAIQGSL